MNTTLKRKTGLRRTGFKKRSQKPQNARSAKKKKNTTPSIRLLKKKLWGEVKRLTRERYGTTCYTCGATGLSGQNLHAGHGKPMAALPLRFKYDVRNIRPQCMVCNCHRGGMTDIFIAKLEMEEEGLDFLEDACYFDEDYNVWRIRQDIPLITGKDSVQFVQNLYSLYRELTYTN